ncbi:helix-turn-helix transcriptional regulator [Rhodococcus sp. G-MC3]|uniref:helix-turn-helix transcriptional regulator n=1 Tax=Rhodococcus sp. G-MC3 TaxID=3046209 RepID=UPI0024B9FBB1|nr:helix-turn-helix transcriptional regulator [Rhodococcus sp. G-MC3]MDJ0396773.1 helix-turn-helix transcriptional regulator [Rhodococcus sp. G-MC3]
MKPVAKDLGDVLRSVDYLVRLEQGRAGHPSAQVVASLARSLQLDHTERDHLYRCAGLLPPADGSIDMHVAPGVARLVTRLGNTPVGVFSAHWNLLSWNPMWVALHEDPTVLTPPQRNLVRALFGRDDTARATFRPFRSSSGLGHFAAALVADIRSAAVTYPSDPTLAEFVDELRTENRYFDSLWTPGIVAVHKSDRKTIQHPSVEELTLDCDVLIAPGSDLRVVIYTAAAGSADSEKLEFLRVATGVAV